MSPPNKPIEELDGPRDQELRGWMAQYGPALRRYFLKKVGPGEAEDMVQEVFLGLQVRGSSRGDIDNVEGYLFRAAANAVVRRHHRQTWDWAGHDSFDDLDDLSDEISPERVLLGKEALERVREAMRALPPRCSEAFFLHRFEEMTYSAIAVQMRITNKAVERLIQRALRRISLSLDPEL